MFSRAAIVLCFYHLAAQSAFIRKNDDFPDSANRTEKPIYSSNLFNVTVEVHNRTFLDVNGTNLTNVDEQVAEKRSSVDNLTVWENVTSPTGVLPLKAKKNQKFSVDYLLTQTFPTKTSNDTGLNPCKADVFLDDIAITFADSRRRYIHRDSEDDQEKHKLISESAKKILEKKKIWKSSGANFTFTNNHRIRKRAAATTVKERLWDDGIVPYEIDENWSTFRKALAKQAMRHWENHTCLKFIERNRTENVNYVFFTEKPCGCCSFVGKRGIGAQALSIGESCARFGIVVHEIGHAIGYYHEHTRPDRDNYVQVFNENIMKGQQTNFQKLPTDQVTSLGLKYDYDSIMHYARNTYSINVYLDTIQPVGIPQGKKVPEIGQRIGLSAGDIQQTQILYNCPKCGKTFQVKSGTFAPPLPTLNSVDEKTECEWRISATPGEKIILNVTFMDIFKSPNCSTDYLEVRDGYWRKSKLLGKFCGRGEISEIKSDSSRMLVTYVAENNRQTKGFVANFEVVCGGVLEVTSEGYLASPNYPEDYHPGKKCIWKITVPQRYQVALKFMSFDLERHEECKYDYVSIQNDLDTNSTVVNSFCGSVLPDHVISTTNEMTVTFVSDKSNQRGGFSAKIIAEFNECEKTDHGCEQICINTLGSFMCSCHPGYEIHSDKRSCVDACGGKFTSLNGTVTSPSFPELYPRNKRCVWEIEAPPQHVIFFNFTHLDLEGNNYDQQLCEYDQVNVSALLVNGKYKELGSFCGTRKPKIINSESNMLQVSFASDDSVQQTGFAAVYFIDKDECAIRNGGCEHDCTNTLGGFQCSCRTGFSLHENKKNCIEGDCVHEIFTPPFGSISSPNYPKYYPASKDCAWHIRTLPGHRLRLAFMNFNLESHPECYFDYVQIFDGDSSKSPQIGRYCGPKVPHLIVSAENQLYMTFKSDNNVHKKGFWATYSTQCGGILQASQEKRQIYSHSKYGNATYPAMESCDWFIIGNDGYNVKLTFKVFILENEEDCSYDYLEVFDGLDSGGSSFGKFCGNQTSQELTSTQEGMVLKFRTDDRIAGQGFILEYEMVESRYSLEEYDTLD
ncbi:bone morphogenetic protein 1-like isoform X2 [Anthonomus grandis grandis]|uniref:bone morphogenetic protein 1-like isoform X2 n=1 Tax=Anthonomus grandis grandis TaxID=2921223 RepID=UPI002166B069|nr:bone morphogenetic protein 1-like isoform X2 [Anthonomus grandis grandis]